MAATATVFIQKSSLGRKSIVLDDGRVTVSGGSGRNKFESLFALEEIAPQPERRVARCYALVVIPLVIGFLSMLGLQLGLRQQAIPKMAVTIPALFLVVLSLWHVIKGFAPLVVIRFRNKRGEVIFDIVKDRGQADEFEEFVGKLRSEIERVRPTELGD